jgi:FKBP-type peptidyl-prolyl cis-trans isomerase
MKKKILAILVILLASLVFWGCSKGNGGSGSSAKEENFDKNSSYALGMNIGSSLAQDGIRPNLNEFMKGIKDSLAGDTKMTEFEAMMAIQTAYQTMMEGKEAESMQAEIDFLAENSKKPGIIITPSGLQYEIITDTTGRKPSASNTVKVHYEGKLTDDTVFDSSYERGMPVEFPLDGVIAGWTEGLQLMGIGSKYRFYIPSELGYGAGGAGPIPPYSTLIFEVELIDIIN